MGITELITKIGDENITFQNLDRDATNLKYQAGKGTQIKFGTDIPLTPSGTEKLGLVVWLPRDKVDEILESQEKPMES